MAGSLKLEQRNSTVLLFRKNIYWTSCNQATPNLWKPMSCVLGKAKYLWQVTIQIKEKKKAYRAWQWNWQWLQLKVNESSDTNQESPKNGVSHEWGGKRCLFFKRKKKRVFLLHLALKLMTKMPLHKDNIMMKPIKWETQILKNKYDIGKDRQAPLHIYPPTQQTE